MYVSVDTYTYTHARQHWVALATDYLDVYVHKLWTYACSYLHPCCFQRRSRMICFVFGRLGMPTHSSMSAAVFKIVREREGCMCALARAGMCVRVYVSVRVSACLRACMRCHWYLHVSLPFHSAWSGKAGCLAVVSGRIGVTYTLVCVFSPRCTVSRTILKRKYLYTYVNMRNVM